MTDEQRNPREEERRQTPFDGDSVAARMQAMMRRCADMIGFGEAVVESARTGAEDEDAESNEPPCSCH